MAILAARLDEGFFADIHGVPQWLTLRGDDRTNPALLILSGPGFGYAALAPFFSSFERAFTLVQWDQPGATDDLYSVTGEVQRYARQIEAPHVELVTVDNAGHAAMFLRAELLAALERHVRPWLSVRGPEAR
jgi:hypothetical protein